MSFTLYAARQLIEYGYHVVPAEGKRPQFQRVMGFDELRWRLTKGERMGLRMNIAILLSGLNVAVVDVDEPDSEWARANEATIASPMTCRTSRGFHAYFRTEGDVPGRKLPAGDLKTRGVVVVPPSEHPSTGKLYEWISGVTRRELLPTLLPALLNGLNGITDTNNSGGSVINSASVGMVGSATPTLAAVRKWIRKAVAVSGQGGHNTTFRVACKLADAGLTEDQVLAELVAWQEDGCAVPKWTLKELHHKARSAVNRKRR